MGGSAHLHKVRMASEAVAKCIKMLQSANSDTEKFAALFMITKLAKAKDCTPASRTAIFNAIGFDYIKRLLLTDDVPVDCPPSMYRSLALSILTAFCNVEELATHPDMLDLVPIFMDMVKAADDETCDLMAIGEAYNCLRAITNWATGRKALLDTRPEIVPTLCDLYTSGTFQSDEALKIVSMLLSVEYFKSPNASPDQLHALLNKVSIDFEADQDKRKFELCTILNALFANCPLEILTDSDCNEMWSQSIYKGLSDVLQSKIGAQQRNPALMLAASVLRVFGVEWALSDEARPKQFFLLLIQLAAIEVRMQLDGKSLKTVSTQKDLITACYIILELSMNYILSDQLELDQKEKQTLYTGLKGAFTAIVNLLLKVKNDKQKPSGEDRVFVYATVRVLAAWLAQETQALRSQVYQLLPFVLELANETFYAYKEAKKSEDKSAVDVLRVLLPGFCHLAIEDEARQILLKANEDQVLCDVLQFHWTIVHYKRPPVPRADRLKMLNQPKQELSAEILADMHQSRTAMVSTCNVLMNITVLEAKYVETSPVFNKLLSFILENLPELKDIPENLVLHGNLAVLGLLLLKQLSNRVKKDDFSICRYIQATIRFLWDAYTVDESSVPPALVVSMAYKEHWMELMELWLLGMQSIAGVIKQIPWITEFTVESGWVEGILLTLKTVEVGTIPANVKMAFEDFLCHLVDANAEVINVMKKADALKVCRKHRCMELGKKLFGD